MFPKDSAFVEPTVTKPVKISDALTTAQRGRADSVGETRRLNTVEVPIEELEAWNRALDDLVQADFDFHTSSKAALQLRIADVRDQIYRWLR